MIRSVTIAVLAALVWSACGSDAAVVEEPDPGPETADRSPPIEGATTVPSTDAPAGGELFPDVLAVEARGDGDGSWTFDVTLSSPYDGPERYADVWRVLGPDGAELGIRVLTHHHAGEQPFTRSLSGVEIPSDVETVTVQGRDQVSGWGGDTVDVVLAPRS